MTGTNQNKDTTVYVYFSLEVAEEILNELAVLKQYMGPLTLSNMTVFSVLPSIILEALEDTVSYDCYNNIEESYQSADKEVTFNNQLSSMQTAVSELERLSEVDGSHHKQYAISQAIKILLGDNRYAEWLKSRPDWDEGIAP